MYFIGDLRGDGDSSAAAGLNTAEVNWINVIRDPIERVVSSFNYLRSEARWRGLPLADIEKPPDVSQNTLLFLFFASFAYYAN